MAGLEVCITITFGPMNGFVARGGSEYLYICELLDYFLFTNLPTHNFFSLSSHDFS